MRGGRRAALPPAGLSIAEGVGQVGSLVVALALEDNPNLIFDLSRMAGPSGLRADLGAAVAAWSADVKGGRRTHSVASVRRGLSAFLRWTEIWNQGLDGVATAQIKSMVDITPFHLKSYRRYLQAEYATNTAYCYYTDIAVVVSFATTATNATRREASKRKGDSPPRSRMVQRYSQAEFVAFRNAARRTVTGAHKRITAARALAQEYKNPMCKDLVLARALHDLLVDSGSGTRAQMSAPEGSKRAMQGGGVAALRRLLFLSPDEVFAAAVLLACQRGLNLSPIVFASTPVEHEPAVIQLDLDKPRRGPNARFWPEIVTDSDVDAENHEGDSGAEVLRLIVEATEPAREHLAARDAPAGRLLVYWPSSQAAPLNGIPGFGTRKKSAWVPEGTTIDFRRIRRSVPGRGVSKEPTDHSPDTFLHYVLSDTNALMEQQEEAAIAVGKMVDHARAGLAVRVAADRETDPGTDAVIVNCSDPRHRPDTGTACTTGFYSFLDCLKCGNAATVLRLLPRQMAALAVLEQLRDSMGESWERRFAEHYYRLVAVVERYTDAERTLAASDVAKQVPIIMAALRHEVPA